MQKKGKCSNVDGDLLALDVVEKSRYVTKVAQAQAIQKKPERVFRNEGVRQFRDVREFADVRHIW